MLIHCAKLAVIGPPTLFGHIARYRLQEAQTSFALGQEITQNAGQRGAEFCAFSDTPACPHLFCKLTLFHTFAPPRLTP